MLSREELREKAKNDKTEIADKKKKEKEKPKEPPARPDAVLKISREYVEWFFEFKATSEQREWIKKEVAELIGEYGDVEYFSKFKMIFAEEFLKDIITEKEVKKSMLEAFFDIEDKESEKQEEAVGDE